MFLLAHKFHTHRDVGEPVLGYGEQDTHNVSEVGVNGGLMLGAGAC